MLVNLSYHKDGTFLPSMLTVFLHYVISSSYSICAAVLFCFVLFCFLTLAQEWSQIQLDKIRETFRMHKWLGFVDFSTGKKDDGF